jgi:hypothetical protein
MGLLRDGNNVEADNQSIAVGGSVNAPITLINNYGPTPAELIVAVKMALADNTTVSYIPGPKEIEWQSELEKLIDQYGEQFERGQTKVAQTLFEGLLSSQKENLTPHLMYRVKANIAICMHVQGQHLEAAKLLHEACDLSPETPKAQANKVLAYLLENKPREAYEYGLARLKENPENENLAAYTIQAIRVDSTLPDPYPEWDDKLKSNIAVGAAYIDYLQSKADPSWRDLAKSLIDAEPEKTKNLAAQYYLDKATQLFNGVGSETDGIDKLDILKKACELYEAEWNELLTGDRTGIPQSIANTLNLLICYGMLRNKAAAEKVCEFILSNYADDQQAMELVLQASVDFNLQDIFQRAVVGSAIPEPVKKKYSLANNIRLENWKELSKIQDYQLERYDPSIKPFACIACYASQAIQRNAEGKRKLERYISQNTLEKKARTLLFDIATECNFPPIIQIAYEYGLSSVTSASDYDEKYLFANVAKLLDDWRTIINLLKGQPESAKGAAKNLLAVAYINDYPIREDAAAFFDEFSLEENVDNHSNLLCGLFYTKRRDTPKACELLRRYLDQGGTDSIAVLALSDMYRLENNHEALYECVKLYDLEKLEGTAAQKMHVAKLLVSYGKPEAGMEYAYSTYEANNKIAEVALGYVHLFLSSEKNVRIDTCESIQAGVHFKLKSSEGNEVEKYVPDNIEDLMELNPEEVDLFVKLSLGLKSGESFTRSKLHQDVTWSVVEIKHKYLKVFHHILQNFEQEFPDATGFWAMKMEGDGIQSLLDFMKKSSEKEGEIIDNFVDMRIPIDFISAMWNKDTFKVAGLIRKFKTELYTCTGTSEERFSAYAIIEKHSNHGAVLDSYTAAVAATTGALPILKKLFGTVTVSSSTIAKLQLLSTELAASPGPGLSIDWHDEQFIKFETTEEQKQQNFDDLISHIESIKSNCEVVNYSFPESIENTVSQILDITGPAPFETYYLAKQNNSILISEDGYSRDYAKALHEIADSAWLQACMDVAVNRGDVSFDDYCKFIVSIAQHRHSHVTLTFVTAKNIFDLDSSEGLFEFRAIAKYIGMRNAEVQSHYQLVQTFLDAEWSGNTTPKLKVLRGTGILLENFTRIPRSLGYLTIFKRISPELSLYIDEWLEGHFLSQYI